MKNHKAILSAIGEVTGGHFAELLVAEVLGGKVVDEDGYDILCPDARQVEVRSRVEGTDSKTPRVTLTAKKMAICTDVVAIRFNNNYVPIEARLVQRNELEDLYSQYLQTDGKTAHLNWQKFCASTGAVDILPDVLAVYDSL
ncbi:hypothetical protein L4D76_19205 [Photobacterium sagamiensis]|uniref:hypothetical protein n=1 Tax=Photobacterium sagamiensis TaxID=2910241 RepID=UPI003D0F84C8